MDDKNERQFEDDLLDAALRQRANAEPRAGLEQQILAGIEARRRGRAFPRWVWVFAAGAAATVVVAFIIIRRPVAPVPSVPPPMTAGSAQPVMPVAAGPAARRMPPPAASAKTVQPATFPSPRPLSPQEKLLLAYVRNGRLGETATLLPQPLDEDLKIPKLDVAALDIKPIESSEKSPER
jgi:hypothetical protein